MNTIRTYAVFKDNNELKEVELSKEDWKNPSSISLIGFYQASREETENSIGKKRLVNFTPIQNGDSSNTIVGQLLTLVEATIPDDTQREAVKSLCKQIIWKEHSNDLALVERYVHMLEDKQTSSKLGGAKSIGVNKEYAHNGNPLDTITLA